MELELRHLKIIRAIAEAGSVTRAATALGLAQSALSGQLKRIERALGGPLFERGRCGARPTALGELVLERAMVLVPAMRELQDEALRFTRRRERPEAVRRLRIGGTHGPLLGGLLDRLADAYPQAALSTYTAWSVCEISELVAAGRLDYALVGVCGDSPPPAADRLDWRTVGRDAVHVMLAAAHPLAGERELELGKLAAESWACVPGDGCFADCFAAACARAGFTPAALYEADTASCMHLVRVGRSAGLCRASSAPEPGVVTVPIAGTPLRWRHVLGWSPGAVPGGVAEHVLAEARLSHAEATRRAGAAGGAPGSAISP
ncbi:LysR family transcriptional regulator [Streptomyces sp. ODS28]|uniref:LysR family transcriptional regulator n=1 Tax=Streptomyces sp. ODS28 TaxID=3136688 RepID=UPI0031EBF1E4